MTKMGGSLRRLWNFNEGKFFAIHLKDMDNVDQVVRAFDLSVCLYGLEMLVCVVSN